MLGRIEVTGDAGDVEWTIRNNTGSEELIN